MQGFWNSAQSNQTRFSQAHTPPKVGNKRPLDTSKSIISNPNKKQKIANTQQSRRSQYTLQTQRSGNQIMGT